MGRFHEANVSIYGLHKTTIGAIDRPNQSRDRSLVYTFTRDDRSARPIAATIALCNHPVYISN